MPATVMVRATPKANAYAKMDILLREMANNADRAVTITAFRVYMAPVHKLREHCSVYVNLISSDRRVTTLALD